MKARTKPCCWECKKCLQGTVSNQNEASGCNKCAPETKPNKLRTKCEQLCVINLAGFSIIVIVFMGFMPTLLVCAFYIKFYNIPIIKASSREVSFLLLFGIAALLALTGLELIEPSDLVCSVRSIWRYAGLNLCITVLFVKTMRITGVFQINKGTQVLILCRKKANAVSFCIEFCGTCFGNGVGIH